jgi:hypothetical protein
LNGTKNHDNQTNPRSPMNLAYANPPNRDLMLVHTVSNHHMD